MVVALAPERALEIAVDKSKTLALAAELGIAAPRTVEIEDLEDVEAAGAEVGFPAVVKPTARISASP